MADLTPSEGRTFGANGVAHLTYFDPTTNISFIYDTSKGDDVIGVARGGYGEPIVDTFDAFEFDDDWGEGPSIADHLRRFEAICHGYLSRMVSQFEIERALLEGFRAGASPAVTGRKYDGSLDSPRSLAYTQGLNARRALENEGTLR